MARYKAGWAGHVPPQSHSPQAGPVRRAATDRWPAGPSSGRPRPSTYWPTYARERTKGELPERPAVPNRGWGRDSADQRTAENRKGKEKRGTVDGAGWKKVQPVNEAHNFEQHDKTTPARTRCKAARQLAEPLTGRDCLQDVRLGCSESK